MDTRPIKTEAEYGTGLADTDRMLGSPIDTPDDDRLEGPGPSTVARA